MSVLILLELHEMCGKVENIKIEQATVTAELLKISSRILLQNILADFENVEILKMYFESKKSGGSEHGVEDVCLVGKGKAVITFGDVKGIRKYNGSVAIPLLHSYIN